MSAGDLAAAHSVIPLPISASSPRMQSLHTAKLPPAIVQVQHNVTFLTQAAI